MSYAARPADGKLCMQVARWQAILGAIGATDNTLNATQKDWDFLDCRVEALRQARHTFQPDESLLQVGLHYNAFLAVALVCHLHDALASNLLPKH